MSPQQMKISDIVTNVSQPTADSHQPGKAALKIYSRVIQQCRYRTSAINNSSPDSIMLKPYLIRRYNRRLLVHTD